MWNYTIHIKLPSYAFSYAEQVAQGHEVHEELDRRSFYPSWFKF